MRTLLQDLRYGWRILAKNHSFTLVAVLTLGLGIGANTAIFSVVEAVVLRPLPYQDPDRLVLVKEQISLAGPEPIPVCAPDVVQIQQENLVFESAPAFQGLQFDFAAASEPERVRANRVSAGLFSLLGIQPVLGRDFTADDDQPGHRVAVLSYGLWQRRFGATAAVLGRTVTLDRQPYTVIGCSAACFCIPAARHATRRGGGPLHPHGLHARRVE